MTAARFFTVAGALAMAVAVAAGAFGAHGLRNTLTPEWMATFETAVRYQAYHALALLAVGVLIGRGGDVRRLTWAGGLFLAGIVVFSGSLYALVLTGETWLGAVTPIGGVAFIAGWFVLAWAEMRRGRAEAPPPRP